MPVRWPRGGYVVGCGSCRLNWQEQLNDSEIPNLWITGAFLYELWSSMDPRHFGMRRFIDISPTSLNQIGRHERGNGLQMQDIKRGRSRGVVFVS